MSMNDSSAASALVYANRRAQLRTLIDHRSAGNIAAFADQFGYSRSRVSQFLSDTYNEGRSIGERAARALEEAAVVPFGWLDTRGTLADTSGHCAELRSAIAQTRLVFEGEPVAVDVLAYLESVLIAGATGAAVPAQTGIEPVRLSLFDASKNLLQWIETAHRPPQHDLFGTMARVRVEALATLADAVADEELRRAALVVAGGGDASIAEEDLAAAGAEPVVALEKNWRPAYVRLHATYLDLARRYDKLEAQYDELKSAVAFARATAAVESGPDIALPTFTAGDEAAARQAAMHQARADLAQGEGAPVAGSEWPAWARDLDKVAADMKQIEVATGNLFSELANILGTVGADTFDQAAAAMAADSARKVADAERTGIFRDTRPRIDEASTSTTVAHLVVEVDTTQLDAALAKAEQLKLALAGLAPHVVLS